MSDYGTSIANGDFFSGNISGTDSIVQLFAELFGSGWHEIGLDAVMGGGSDSASMIIAVLGAINLVAMNAGALMLGWVAMSATMGTAHEGQFLGKRFHDFWMPLRSGLSITFLAPVAKGGLCVVQIIGLIFIGFSIQFSNLIKDVGLDYMLANRGNVTSISVPPQLEENAKTLATGLLKTLVIQYHYNLNQEKKFKFYEIGTTLGYSFAFYGPNYKFGLKRALSYVIVTKPDIAPEIAQKRAAAVQAMYHTLSPLALAIVTNSTSEFEDRELNTALYKESIDNYIAAMAPEAAKLLSEKTPEYQKELEKFVDQVKTDGVLWLGSYYHAMSRFSGKVHAAVYDFPKFQGGNLSGISNDMNVLLASALETVRDLKEQLEEQIEISASGNGSGSGVFSRLTNSITNLGVASFISSVTDGDPLANLADWGHTIMGTSEAILGTYYGLVLSSGTAEGIADSGLGKIVSVIPGASLIKGGIKGVAKVIDKLGPVALFLAIPLMTLGIMMAVYLPAVPYVIWMSAMVGCLILWLEFLVHMPIWSITFATGEGEGLAGQRSQQGLLLIANAIFRLPLMTAGFLIAVVIMPKIGAMIGATMLVMTPGITTGHVVGVPTMIAIWFLFGGFTVLQTHVVFGLVTHLPEGAMKFFGGAVQSMGEAQHEAKTRALIMGSLGKGETVGQGMFGKGGPADPQNLKGKGKEQNQLSNQNKSHRINDDLMPGER